MLGDAFAGMRHTWVHTKLRTSGAASPACPPRLPRVGRARRGGATRGGRHANMLKVLGSSWSEYNEEFAVGVGDLEAAVAEAFDA